MEIFESNLTAFLLSSVSVCTNKMLPSKSKRSETRCSSILKPRKPRQPLENVNFDSSSDENSPTASKVKRRVSFAEKKHVKEFCHTNEQGTVWDNTYEEHDFSLKGSFVADQNAEAESRENASLYASNNDCTNINSDSNSCYPNNAYLANNQLSQESVKRTGQDNDTNCDLDFTNPVKSMELCDISQLGCAILPSKSCVSKDTISSGIVCNDTDEECMELSKSQSGQTVITNASYISENVKSKNITIYIDSDEENCVDNVANKYESYSNNVNSELDMTRAQNISVELTAPICASLLSSHLHAEEQEEHEHNNVNNFDTNYPSCNNVSMEITEAVPIFTKSATSDLEIPKQIPTTLQNCENTKWDAANSNTMSSTILQSNVSEDIISEHTSNVNYANDSMILTSVIQPFIDVTGTGTCSTNNTAFNTSIEMIVSPKIDEKNTCNENIVKENDLRKDHYYATDKTEVFNDSPMEMTKPVSTILPSNVIDKENFRVDEPISRDDRTILFHNISMEMTKTVSTRNKQEITDTITCKPLSEKNAHSRKDVNTLACFTEGILCKSIPNYANDSMTLTSVIQPFIDVTDTGTCSTNNTAFNTSIEMIVPSKINEKNTCNENIVKENDLRKDHYYATDKTEVFNDSPMEMTKPVSTILPSNVIDKENFRVDEPISRDDRTILFHNISMEMTKTVSTRNKQEITDTITCKPLSEENSRKDVNTLACFTEGILCKSMELTETVPSYHERIFYAAHAQSVSKSTCSDLKNDKTKFVNDESTEITKSINILPSSIDKENLKIHESVSRNDKTMHNVFMEMPTAVSPRNRQEITLPISCKSISKEHITGEKDTNNSTCFNEETKLLCKSMEFTEVPISLHDEKTFNTTQSTSFSQTLSKIYLPAENSTGVAFQTDAITNETIQDISMEITAAVPSTLHLTQDEKMNKTENLIISKDNGFQHLTTNINQTESRKSVTKENLTISREIVEIGNIRHDELSNTIVTQSPLDNLVHSDRLIDYTQVPDSNRRDSLNEIGEYSFLRKSLSYLENSLEELQSIKPPSFVCLDSEEENSFHKIQHELQASTITNIPINNISNPLTINNVVESKCLIDSRKNVANDFTILREKEMPINIENDLVESCHGSTIMNKIEGKQETNCQVITKTIINDDQFNKSNYYVIENINEPSILSMNANDGTTVQDVNHCTSLIIKEIEVIDDEDQVDERTYIQKRINEDAKLQNNIKEKRQSLDKKRQEVEECSDDFESTRTIIKNQISPEVHRTNLNGEEIQQNMEQKDECATERLVTEQHVSTIENVKNISLTEQDSFLTLLQKLETYAASDDCIWDIYYKNIDRKMIVFGFMSDSLLIPMFLSYDFNGSEENLIKEIKIISRVADAGVLIRIVHKLILEKINAEILTNLYRTHEDILPMLNFISQDVKLAMDFMFDLRHLDDLNLMEIDLDKISFVSRSKLMDIILKVTIKVKRFDKLTSNDVNICCILGGNLIKETEIKSLIKNVKKDHKFLRRCMNDVKDYVDIMETFK